MQNQNSNFSLSRTFYVYINLCRTLFLKIFKIKFNDMEILCGALYFISCKIILYMNLISEHISSTIQWNKIYNILNYVAKVIHDLYNILI